MTPFTVYSSQYGRGLGGILSGLSRVAIPLILPMLKSVGRSLLLKGAEALTPAPNPVINRPRRGIKRMRAASSVPVRDKKRYKQDILA